MILFGGFAKAFATDEMIARRVKVWGAGEMINGFWPSQATNREAVKQVAKFEDFPRAPAPLKPLWR